MAKQLFTVRIVRTEEDRNCGGHSAGPFVVHANSERGAFRAVRNRFGSYLTNHISRERRALECNGITSDRTGKLLNHAARTGRDLRSSYAG